MNRRRNSTAYVISLFVFLLTLLLAAVASVSGGALEQIDPTAEQETIAAVVQTRLAQTAVMQQQVEATRQAVLTLNSPDEATQQAATVAAQMTLDSLATAAFEAEVNRQVAGAVRATLEAGVNNPVQHNADWTPRFQSFSDITMVLVPPGCFSMGNDPETYDASSTLGVGDGGGQCFTTPFYISRYEVTNEQFEKFGCSAEQPSAWTDSRRPRETITWFEAHNCAAKIDQQLGGGWRLPTEAEWEYAARGPDDLIYPWGNTWNPNALVWSANSSRQTTDVGSRPQGASWVGAEDLIGNVWEWISTIYAPYPYSADDGRENDADTTSPRVMRGGAWIVTDLNYFHSAYRGSYDPSVRGFRGFRLVRSYTTPE